MAQQSSIPTGGGAKAGATAASNAKLLDAAVHVIRSKGY
jgi:hypothetical protein